MSSEVLIIANAAPIIVEVGAEAEPTVVVVEPQSVKSIEVLVEKPLSVVNITNFSARELAIINGYVHEQIQPSSTWIVAHGLAKYPSVVTVDIDRTEIFANIEYVDQNTVQITFSELYTGFAYIT